MKKITAFALGLMVSLWSIPAISSYGLGRIPLTALAMESPVFSMGVMPSLVVYTPKLAYGLSFSIAPADRLGVSGAATLAIGPKKLPMGLGVTATYESMGNMDLANESGAFSGVRSLSAFSAGLVYGVSLAELTKVDIKLGVAARYAGKYIDTLPNDNLTFDISGNYTLRTKSRALSSFGALLGVNNFASISMPTNFESEPVIALIGAYLGLVEDRLTVAVNLSDSGTWADIASGKWLAFNANLGWALVPNLVTVRLGGDLALNTTDFKVSAGITYRTGFAWFGYHAGGDNLGVVHTLSLESTGEKSRYVSRSEGQQAKIDQGRDLFAQAMVAFSKKEYKEAKALFEQSLVLDPNNSVAKSFLEKIKEILSLEE